MKKENRTCVIQTHDTTMMCPGCYRLQRIGKVSARINIERSDIRVPGDRIPYNPNAVDISEYDMMLHIPQGDKGEYFHPVYWTLATPFMHAKCPRCEESMLAVDTVMANLVSLLNDYCVYVKDSSAGEYCSTEPRKYSAYIKFFYTVPFWLWAKWRTIKVEGNKYALELADNGCTVRFCCGGSSQIEPIIRQMLGLTQELIWPLDDAGDYEFDRYIDYPLLEDWRDLFGLIIPTLRMMAAAAAEDEVKNYVDSPVRLHYLPGDPYPPEFEFCYLDDPQAEAKFHQWYDQLECFVWNLWHEDHIESSVLDGAYEASAELCDWYSYLGLEEKIARHPLGYLYNVDNPEVFLDRRDYPMDETDEDRMFRKVRYASYMNSLACIAPRYIPNMDKPESEMDLWERHIKSVIDRCKMVKEDPGAAAIHARFAEPKTDEDEISSIGRMFIERYGYIIPPPEKHQPLLRETDQTKD